MSLRTASFAFAICLALLSCSFVTASHKKAVVVVIDTGLNLKDPRYKDVLCETGHADFSGQGMIDVEGHGTGVVGLIKKYAKSANYCIVVVKYWHSARQTAYESALRYAVSLAPQYINISAGGEEYMPFEELAIKFNPKVMFVVAAGNNNKHYGTYYPAALLPRYKNMVVVGSVDHTGKKADSSNYGEGLKWEEGALIKVDAPVGEMWTGGTSLAAPIHLGKMLYENKTL